MSWTDYIPAALTGFQYLNNSNGQSQYSNASRQAIQADWENQKKQYDYDVSYNQQAAAASDAARAANAAARSQTDKNRRKAEKEALKIKNTYSKQLLAMYAPYMQTAQRILPQMEGAYGKGLGQLDMMRAYANRPEVQARMSQSIPAGSVPLQLSSYFAGGRK